MQLLDTCIIVVYFCGMLLAGYAGSKMTKNHEDFMVAGRRLPLWVYFPCMVSVVLGGSATFATSKLGYMFGISGAWLVIMYGLGILALGLLMTTKISNLRVISLSEMLEKRYNSQTRYISAVVSCVYTSMIAVLQVIAIGTIIHSLAGWPLSLCMVIGGGIALAYTLAGGMLAVTITDVVQFVFMTVGVIGLLLPAGLREVGGFSGLKASLPEAHFDFMALGGGKIFSYFLLLTLGMMIGQDIWQRVFTAKTDKIAKTGTIATGFFAFAWAIAVALIGMCAAVLLPNLADPQSAIPDLIVKVLPSGAIGIVLAGVISALMSTFDGPMLATSTLIMNDIIKPLKGGVMSEERFLSLSRIVTFVAGIVVIALAVWVRDVLAALDIAYAILSGGIFVPIVAGFFWRRATWQGAMASIIASCVVIFITMAVKGISANEPIMYGMATSLVVLVVASLLTPQDHVKLADWEQRVAGNHPDDEWEGEVAAEQNPS